MPSRSADSGFVISPALQSSRNLPTDVRLSTEKGATTGFVVPELPTIRDGKTPPSATVYVILEVRYNGTPNLWAYRRAVVTSSRSVVLVARHRLYSKKTLRSHRPAGLLGRNLQSGTH
jgi:hypothetical protein